MQATCSCESVIAARSAIACASASVTSEADCRTTPVQCRRPHRLRFHRRRTAIPSRSTGDVQTVIAQAVSAALAINRPVTVAVTDREGNVLGVFDMTGAPLTTQIRGGGQAGHGLENLSVPSTLAAISKAGTAGLFSTQGNAFTTRTAGFIIQEHFPPRVDFQPGGPLYGVQFSSLPCGDIKKPSLPLGLSADPGSVPLYKNGVAVGGVGIEGDGFYTLDREPADFDKPAEELIAVAAARGYDAPPPIRGDNILVSGIRLAYLNVTDEDAPRPAPLPFAGLPGVVDSAYPIRGAQPSSFVAATIGGVNGSADTRFFPVVGSTSVSANALTASDVGRIVSQAAQQAEITRAAIRQPLGSQARVSIAVVDADGVVLGIFRTTDAPDARRPYGILRPRNRFPAQAVLSGWTQPESRRAFQY